MSESYKKILLVILTGIAYGSSIVFARYALKEIGPYPITVLRFGIASTAFLITFFILKKRIPSENRVLRDMTIVGVVGTGLPLLLFYFSLSYMSSGIFTVFLATLPIFTAVLAHLFLKSEKIHRNLLVGLIIALAGVVILIATRSNGLVNEGFNIKGPVFALIGVLSASVGVIYTKSHLNKEDVFVISATQTLAAFIFIAAVVFIFKKFQVGQVSPMGWFAIFYNGMVGSFIAFWLTFTLIKKYGATASALPNYIMPVVSTLIGSVFLGELITFPLFAGALMILMGVFFSTKKVAEIVHK